MDQNSPLPSSSPGTAAAAPELPPMSKEELEKIKKKLDQLKEKVEKFQKKLLEKFEEYIIGIALLPPEKKDSKDIHLLVLVDDSDVQKISPFELREKMTSIVNKIAEEVDKDFKQQIMLMNELRESCFDAKYEILQLISFSAPFYDPRDVFKAI